MNLPLHIGEHIVENTSDKAVLQILDQKLPLNEKQQTVFNVYYEYLKNPYNSNTKPPPIVLVTGMGGTGKSHLKYYCRTW